MTHDETYTYRLEIDTTILDPDQYDGVLRSLTAAVAWLSERYEADGFPHRFTIRDTSALGSEIAELGRLD